MTQILDWIIDFIKTETAYSPVVGAVPPVGGVAIAQSGGTIQTPYFVRTGAVREVYAINAKGVSQKDTLLCLETIHEKLTKIYDYGHTESWQIATIRTLNAPNYLGQENNENYLYGSSIEVLYYDRRKAERG